MPGQGRYQHMNTTTRALTTLALAGAALAVTGTAQASGILGLGNNGGQNRDESFNQNLAVFGDSLMSGQGNALAPSVNVHGIDGIGTPYAR